MKKDRDMRKILALFFLFSFFNPVYAANVPVYSANGFMCAKSGISVTCKGPIPGGTSSITGTGHNLVYLTVDLLQEGQPIRYTYFSDTGCLIGYTLGPDGSAIAVVARHRTGEKGTFSVQGDNYDGVIQFCERRLGAESQAASRPVTTSQKPATPAAKPATSAAKPSSTSPVKKK